ncbi:DUF362 domain-containing protein [bacterium]|nr:DUF362 domain-containing protein [bacterium]
MKSQSIVSIVPCADYQPEHVSSAVIKSLELAGLDKVIDKARNILLKPNLLSTRLPEEAVTTHPAIVRAIGQCAQSSGSRVSLGDSPPFAGENAQKYAKLCERTGMSAVASELGIPLVRFEEDVVTAANPGAMFYHSFEVSRLALESDLIINISKLKTHGLTAYTGAVKNIFGCIPGVRKGLFHVQSAERSENFSQMLVDLLRVFRPAVNVMDAVIAMEGEGPNAGSPKQVGLIIASNDAVALDAVACSIIGIDPMSIDTTRLAHEQGLGCADLDSIDIRGESIDSVRVSDFRLSSGRNDWHRIPSPIRKILRRQLVAVPIVNSSECVGCGDCARACPVHAITAARPPIIDLDKCIRCYCCHEVCNFSAIRLRRGWLGNMFDILTKR